jgi:hypothetical protein
MSQSGCRLQKVGVLAVSDVLQNQYLKPEVATVSFQQTYLIHCCFETLCSVIKIVNSYHKLGIADSKKINRPSNNDIHSFASIDAHVSHHGSFNE